MKPSPDAVGTHNLSGLATLSAVLISLTVLGAAPPSQQRPLPIIDMHLHALPADGQGPPPLAVCPELSGLPVWDQRRSWGEIFFEYMKKPPCTTPVWSPLNDDALRDQTIEILRRRNVIGVVSGTEDRVDSWRKAAPEHLIPGLIFALGENPASPERLRERHQAGQLAVFGEVLNQYAGIAPDDAAFEPYLATMEALDVPVGIHIGTGPPGAPHLGFNGYRARLHSALALEEPLMKHPKLRVYVMHAGWPAIDDLLAVMWAHPQVHVDVGIIVWGLPRAEFYAYLQRIMNAGFGKRVMFGSDQMQWPGMIEYAIDVVEQAPTLTSDQKRDILYNNAARFLRLPPNVIDRHHGRR
jgi:uncharacterized protein